MVRIHHSLHLTLLRYVYRDGGNIEIVISLMDKTLSLRIFTYYFEGSSTYDHRTLKTRLPVRSALFKQRTGGLVVRWVTTSEYPLLYVFCFIFEHCLWMGDHNRHSQGNLLPAASVMLIDSDNGSSDVQQRCTSTYLHFCLCKYI